jgi:tRNA(Ile)-lysidine synthase
MPTAPLVSAVRRSLESVGLLRPGVTVVAALSGGPDSVALTDALLKAARKPGIRVVAAHLDHTLRRDSREDAQFCEEFCDRLKLPLRSGRAQTSPRAMRDGGLEEAARLIRYSFLRRVAREENASAIVLGHTLDDQAETVLMRLVRGSGALGLSAMKPWDGELLRPLLETRRAAVLAHLSAHRLPYRSDPTNDDTTFLRNRVRHDLIPLLEKRFNPNIAEALGRTARTLAEENSALREVAAQLLDRASVSAVSGVALEISVLKSAPEGLGKTAIREALRRFGGLRAVSFVHIERLWGLVAQGRGGSTLPLPGGRDATVNRGRLILTGPDSDPGHSREKPFLS